MIPRERVEASPEADTSLVERIVAGDLESLGVLFDRYEPDVRRTLARLGVGSSDVDDLIQATFLQVITAAPKFDPRFAVRSWLLGIAAMMVRRRRRSVRRLADRIASFAKAVPERAPETPDAELALHETEERVKKALDRLSPKLREAFVLVTLEGATGEEAAAALGIPINTLWTRLHHARKELRAALLEDPS
jgi:RNA polymerase sigma-70 factor (ECF subfamily)